jgi:predicted transcriptional regulator YheO
MNFNMSFLENNVSIAEDTWTALVTTGSDMSLANVRTTIMGVLERHGTFTVEDTNEQVVRRIETSSEFEGFMQEVDMQRSQFQQDQAQ